jgi:hypothetical protein
MAVASEDIIERKSVPLITEPPAPTDGTLSFTHELRTTVRAAYGSIPHRMVRFQVNDPNVTAGDRDYLTTMFRLIDQAVVLRTSANKLWDKGAGVHARHSKRYQQLILAFEAQQPPAHLQRYHSLIMAAAKDHADVFASTAATTRAALKHCDKNGGGCGGISIAPHNSPKARSASTALKQAWGELKRTYPKANGTNQKAFFDYLCAMDYI